MERQGSNRFLEWQKVVSQIITYMAIKNSRYGFIVTDRCLVALRPTRKPASEVLDLHGTYLQGNYNTNHVFISSFNTVKYLGVPGHEPTELGIGGPRVCRCPLGCTWIRSAYD